MKKFILILSLLITSNIFSADADLKLRDEKEELVKEIIKKEEDSGRLVVGHAEGCDPSKADLAMLSARKQSIRVLCILFLNLKNHGPMIGYVAPYKEGFKAGMEISYIKKEALITCPSLLEYIDKFIKETLEKK